MYGSICKQTACAHTSSFNLKLDFPFRYIDFLVAFKRLRRVLAQNFWAEVYFIFFFSKCVSCTLLLKQLSSSVCHFYDYYRVDAQKCCFILFNIQQATVVHEHIKLV